MERIGSRARAAQIAGQLGLEQAPLAFPVRRHPGQHPGLGLLLDQPALHQTASGGRHQHHREDQGLLLPGPFPDALHRLGIARKTDHLARRPPRCAPGGLASALRLPGHLWGLCGPPVHQHG